ncbi:class D sortase [Clostridium sp. MSJ-4]|uniref:Class D sortase n=1 Tax=Clostridium simiarum TaxID=2841506 RepID=A0ABS6F0H1_9CLOT|nr:class D sortase [Clostridium simiarum]MBU5591994.1 class D sortase [Clostridium simiarum]
MNKRQLSGALLIIVGILIICTAAFMRFSSNKKQKDMMDRFENTLKNMGDYDIKEGDNKSPNGGPNYQEIDAIALMIIPKINVNAAVAEGTDMDTLKFAVGHFEGTAMPGEKGNFAVAGHRNYTYSEYFKRADELESGDEILVRTKGGEYKYKVTEKKIVEPEAVEVLNSTKDATLTIVTCTPGATKRLIINGKLQD